ncbi:uncharacterized protein LOC123564723 [Mercenaria mercenaria]|uniref:uncharacterized protein LOC123564723 n=1 Tax=Mercenaria mercenaria TaxID=6596 RepID=UPI00234EC67B|nr:uncharacterized protein LOC123564723 [Mercenaria mercenaria]
MQMFQSNIGMISQLHLEKKKFRHWAKAMLGIKYLKEGIAPFCDDVARQQHEVILDNIRQSKNLQSVTCAQCALNTLKPDHVKSGKKQCPLGQANCNCWYEKDKWACCGNVCGAIYDTIITYHANKPPAPYWKNTNSHMWTRDPWSIAKCFINSPGYDQASSAADTDCMGLLHVIINNKYFHNHVGSNMANAFSKVRQDRNEIFHSSTMELEEAEANAYIDDMIAALQDGEELKNRQDAQDAVNKLEELKNGDFNITTQGGKGVPENALVSICNKIEDLENTTKKANYDIDYKHNEVIENIEKRMEVALQHALQEFDQHALQEFERLTLPKSKEDKTDTIRQEDQKQFGYVEEKQDIATQQLNPKTSGNDTEQSIVSEYDSDGRTSVNSPELKDEDRLKKLKQHKRALYTKLHEIEDSRSIPFPANDQDVKTWDINCTSRWHDAPEHIFYYGIFDLIIKRTRELPKLEYLTLTDMIIGRHKFSMSITEKDIACLKDLNSDSKFRKIGSEFLAKYAENVCFDKDDFRIEERKTRSFASYIVLDMICRMCVMENVDIEEAYPALEENKGELMIICVSKKKVAYQSTDDSA